MPTLGEYLVHDILPPGYRPTGQITKGSLNKVLVDLAKKEPEKYSEIVTKLKRLGDEMSTLDTVSVGLDDVGPDIKARDAILDPFHIRFKAAPEADKEKILREAQAAMLKHTMTHPGIMTDMVRSGGRGKDIQLMSIVGAPVLATDEKDKIVPWMLRRSYAEGLTPADAWVAGNQARINAIKSNISVVEPGDLSKILINNMGDKLITRSDCGTTNGILLGSKDSSIIDRHLARTTGNFKAGTLITSQVAQHLGTFENVLVRSPMTCEAPHGICQKCQGLDSSGRPNPIGTNVGMRAAQALSEPLTQFALNAKHGGRKLTGTGGLQLEGIKGVRQVLEIPESFLHKATLADHDGEVSRVEAAPQGGHYVWVGDTRHYLGPNLRVTAPVGTKVEAGDMLSNGVPKPDEVVRHKGLGEGRQYLVNTLHNIYKNSGSDVDRRHLETLARSVMNNVTITDPGDDAEHGFIKGDVVNYNRFRAALADSQQNVSLHDALGETLASNLLHYTAGTRITPTVRDALAKQNIKTIPIAHLAPQSAPLMRPATRTPLMNGDWMARLAHRYLKESLVAGAHRGDVADLHSYSPVPAYAAGKDFGQGEEGRY